MPRALPPHLRARGVTAVLGPTNTGKTHLAIERLVAHSSGMIGLPLRLLAREVYARVVEKVGVKAVALVTGEEKIKPEKPRYWVATVEAMPKDLDLAFVAVDEIQLASDLDRGHVFTDRLLNQRGRDETLLIGSGTMRPLVEALVPGVQVVTRPRLSSLGFAGDKKISRLPPRSAIVAFSAEEVYAIAELIRRHRGGAAVVLGALSPRTRNAQVALFEAGEVDYLIATDAIGMGLNLDVTHVAFAGRQKYDGFQFRDLHPAELGQIAGRAGRHMRDGTFGSTGRCEPFDPETIDALENHRFEPVRIAQWRNPDLDTGSLAGLLRSLAEVPREPGLTKALVAEDEATLAILSREEEVKRMATSRAAVTRLWEVCGLPDYRRVSPMGHADMVSGIYGYLMGAGRIPADWFARQLAMVDRTEGDIDTLSQRLAHVRTWSFVANRPDWLADPEHWQGATRRIEDNLSDALHERLAARFVDRRTSVLMRRLRENATMEAEITSSGDVTVEGQHVGHLHGFQFVADPAAEGTEARAALRNAAAKALAGEIEGRAERFSVAPDTTLVLSNDGTVRWTGDPVARLEPGEKIYDPHLRLLADEQLTGPARDKVETRLKAWLKALIVRLLGPALELETAAELTGLARGIGFQVFESLGILERSRVAQDLRSLDQAGRAALRGKGVRFGAYHVYMPALIKPAPRTLATQLWALKNGGLDQKGIDELAHLAGSGRTSFPVDPEIGRGLYRAAGFRPFPTRAVRVDILERLADLIRPAVAYRPGTTPGDPPPGTADGEGFVSTGGMTSLVGTSGEDFAAILKSLGYSAETRAGPAITVPLVPARPKPEPVAAAAASEAVAETSAQEDAEAVPADGSPAPGDDPPGEVAAFETGAPSLVDEADPILDEASGPDEVQAVDEAEMAEVTGLADPLPDEIVELASEAFADPTHLDEAPEAGDAPEPYAPPDLAAELGLDPPLDQAEEEVEPEVLVSPPIETPAEMVSGDVTAEDVEPAADPTLSADTDVSAEPVEAAEPVALSEPAEPAEQVEPAEPVMIEVWRLQRHQREQHPRGRQGRRNDDRRQDRGRPAGGERRPGPPPAGQDRGPVERRAEGDAARPEGQLPEGGPPQGERPQGDRPQGERSQGRRFDRGPGGAFGRGDRPPGGPRPAQDSRPPGEGRGDRRGGQRSRDERPRFEQRPERRDRAPDPNSPFAALAALKAQLEAKEREGS